MQSPSVVRRHSESSSANPATLMQVEVPPAKGAPAAANDDAIFDSAEYRPNPLWAVNAAFAAFFFIAALLIASG